MDDVIKQRGSSQARYYASQENRGQRMVNTLSRVEDIPSELYRCHLSETWYGRLPEWKRRTVKPSPKGWEVDEELTQKVTQGQAQAT